MWFDKSLSAHRKKEHTETTNKTADSVYFTNKQAWARHFGFWYVHVYSNLFDFVFAGECVLFSSRLRLSGALHDFKT